jgi:hypothetical protein
MASSAAANLVRSPLAVAILGLALLWAIWYPPAISIEDESAYLTQAQIFGNGDVFGEASTRTVGMAATEHGWVSKYPPGQSLMLAPLQLLHWRAGFLVSLALTVVASLLCAATLKRNGLAPAWSVLLLLHPAVVLYSRTMMSEALALFVVAVALWASDPDEPRAFTAGLSLGAMAAVRTALLPTALVFASLMLVRRSLRSDRKRLGRFLLGGSIAGLVLTTYNQVVFGDPFSLRLDSTGSMAWSTAHERGLFYLLALNVLWPGMLVGVFAARHRRTWDVQLLTGSAFIFFSGYFFVDRRYGIPVDLVVGFRFFVPLLPIMVLGYAGLLQTVWKEQARSVGWSIAASLALVVSSAFVVQRHQAFLLETANRRDVAVEAAHGVGTVVAHGSAAELFNPAWGAPPVVLVSSVDELRQAVAAACGQGAIGFAQGPTADELSGDASAVTPVEGLTIVRSDPSSCPRGTLR